MFFWVPAVFSFRPDRQSGIPRTVFQECSGLAGERARCNSLYCTELPDVRTVLYSSLASPLFGFPLGNQRSNLVAFLLAPQLQLCDTDLRKLIV